MILSSSIVNTNADLDGLLDQLIELDMSCSSADDLSFKDIKYLEEGIILLLKKVRISDFKRIIPISNGFFKC